MNTTQAKGWKRCLALIAAAGLLLPLAPAFAEDAKASPASGGLYGRIGLASVSTEFRNVGNAITLGGVLGVQLASWFSVEASLDQTIRSGANAGGSSNARFVDMNGNPVESCPSTQQGITCFSTEPANCPPEQEGIVCSSQPGAQGEGSYTRSAEDLRLTNLGLFAVLRTPGSIFLTGKFGYRTISASIPEIQDGDRSGIAYAAGIGFSRFELGYTRYSSQLDYLGASVSFGLGQRAPGSRVGAGPQ